MPFPPSFTRVYPAILLGVLLLFGQVNQAWADPHAVFYTATGQQQLFFNVLAALDQADYVEPAKNTTGTPAGSSRQELLDRRTTAGFGAETDVALKATKTDLAGVVTRGITLEGNDLWSSYLTLQFALERSRVTASDEITQIFCERGLGQKGCKDTVEARKGQSRAYDTNPDVYAIQPTVRGAIGTFASGLKEYDEVKDKALQDNSGPWSYSQNIAGLRTENKDDPNKKKLVESQLETEAASFISSSVNPNVFKDIEIKSTSQDGKPTDVTFKQDKNSDDFVRNYIRARMGVTLLSGSLKESGLAAELAMQDFYDSPAVTGAGGGKGNLETYKDGQEVRAKVTLPAGVKDELAKAPVNQIANFELNRAYVPSGQNALPPGNQPLVPGQAGGAVKGLSSDDAALSASTDTYGQVAGIADENDPDHHGAAKPLDPQSLPIAFHHEESPKDYLKIASGGENGCGCSLQNAVNDFGQAIIRRINGL